MNRRVLKYNVAAALFSAAFLFGINFVDAYVYDKISVDATDFLDPQWGIFSIQEDENDLIITNGSNIKVDEVPSLIKAKKESFGKKTAKTVDIHTESWVHSDGTAHSISEDLKKYNQICSVTLKNVPMNMSKQMHDDFIAIGTDGKFWNSKLATDMAKDVTKFNEKYGTNLIYTCLKNSDNSGLYKGYGFFGMTPTSWDAKTGNCTQDGYDYFIHDKEWDTTPGANGVYERYYLKQVTNETDATYNDYKEKIEDAAIFISNKSKLEAVSNVTTLSLINVDNTSQLIAGDTVSAKNIYADGIITSKIINATNDITSGNSISASNKISTNKFTIGGINATSATLSGNQSINGSFTTNSKANLNGGAVLGNHKINGLSAGTLSATSTEAVNGSQLNTIKQKIASIGGKTYTAGSDVAITNANAISVTKSGMVDKGNTGIVTGGAVYKITSALNQSLDSLKASVNSHQSTLTNLSQGLSDLKSSVTNINSSVASATKNLSAQLTNRLQSDMGNLSADGKNVIRNMVSSTLKSMNSMSVKDTTLSPVATYEAKDSASNTELDTIHTSLDTKVDKGNFADLSSSVASNSKQVEDNAHGIQKNSSAISDLQLSKADADGSNISIDGYSEKLGTGKVESGNHELVNGNTVYDALSKKADIGYVDSGLGMVSSQLDAMSQGLTRDMNRVGAGAAALAGLHPTRYDASDKLSFAYSGGHYKNANTSALGAFYHPNERTMVSVAGTIGNNDAMLSAGMSIKVGMGDHVSKVIVTPKMFSVQEVANQDMKDHLNTQSERLQQIESTLQSRISR